MVLKKFLAVDLGASSGRLVQGVFNGTDLQLSEVHRFKNESVNINNGLYWDIIYLIREIKKGIKIASDDNIKVESISVDTWGVDFGYLDHNGDLISNPHCYRDDRTLKYSDNLYSKIDKKELYSITGVKPANINTINQIFSDINEKPYLKNIVKNVLFMPDLINYLLSGNLSNEFTISSTSGLMDIKNKTWAQDIFEKLEIPIEWFLPVQTNGSLIGKLNQSIVEELNIESFSVISGASHDTAAAVLAIPYEQENNSAFISNGTWSLIGVESISPVVSKEAYEANITNEGCFSGNYRILKNTTGMWIIQELQREWRLKGEDVSFEQMVQLASTVSNCTSFINPNFESFITPDNMENKIIEYLKKTKQRLPKKKAEIIRCVYESLAFSYRQTIEQLETLTNMNIDNIHMVGGGTKNKLLCQLTADLTGKKVIAGPIEASALGNILSQMLVLNEIKPDDIVEIVKKTEKTITYYPQQTTDIESRYLYFKEIMRVGV